MKFADLAIVFATLFGPVFAVQIQKALDRRGETNRRQVEVFRALMAARSLPNSPQYVNALNAVPVEFHKVQSVMTAWTDMLMHLNTDAKINTDAWLQTRLKRFIGLLQAMSNHLRYGFREVELQDHAYFPEWQLTMMNDQELVRKGLVDLMTGKASLPMTVKDFPADHDMAARTAALQILLIEWLEGKRTPTVTATIPPGASDK